jgi:hypothetical protein
MVRAQSWGMTHWLRVAIFTMIALALIAIVVTMSNARSGTIHYTPGSGSGPLIGLPGRGAPPAAINCSSPSARCYRTRHTSRGKGTVLLPAEIAFGFVVAAGTVFFLLLARRGQEPEQSSLGSAEPPSPARKTRRRPTNPREAVLAAFADLEDHLAGVGFTREPWEAAESYLARAMPDAWREGRAARRLARLYALARFSHHPIDTTAASEAIEASRELVVAAVTTVVTTA